MYEVAVIGGGVIGGLILRELARYDLNAVLLENFSFHTCTKDIIFTVRVCFGDISIIELRGGRAFNNTAVFYERNAKLPDVFVFINAVNDIRNIKCRVISGNSKIVFHKCSP